MAMIAPANGVNYSQSQHARITLLLNELRDLSDSARMEIPTMAFAEMHPDLKMIAFDAWLGSVMMCLTIDTAAMRAIPHRRN